jgi:hydrogenase nickel incorporation protein HypA/HybF
MHEQSIVNSLVDVVTEQVIRSGATRATALTIEVGELSGVVPAALMSAFSVSKRGTVLESATLTIEPVAVVIHCDRCRGERPAEGVQRLACSDCRTPSGRVVRGRELDVVKIEVE